MHSQIIFKMRTGHFLIVKKESPLTGETISSCRRPVLFGSRALCEIYLLVLRHNNKSHVPLRFSRRFQRQSDTSVKVRIKCIDAVSNKSE